MRAAIFAFGLLGCALNKPPSTVRRDERIAIVASEQGPRGVRLVAIDEHGDRRFELITPPDRLTQDKNPAISPDGAWIVFASTRERAEGTSLWIAKLGVESRPRRLTTGDAIDAHPVWTPDGAAIVFASTRDGGDYDLYRLPITAGIAGVLAPLTSAPGHEITPTVAPDRTVIYAAVDATDGRVTSRLEERAPDGTITAITEGPADTSPAVSPDGTQLVFARPAIHLDKVHSELWRMNRRGDRRASPLVALPITDESGPVWSRDGRFVFATSRLAGAETPTLFSSVVHVDLQESPPRARILSDRAVAVARLTPAIVAKQLDVAALRGDPEYLPELARIMAAKIAEQRR
jgi:Tol biopolymer transport system component